MYLHTTKKTKEKIDNCAALLRNLQVLYHDYRFEIISILVGAQGYVPKELEINLEKLNVDEKEVNNIMRKLQIISTLGTVKIVRTFMGF